MYVARSTRRTVNETHILELQYGVKECDQRIGMCPIKPNRFQQASFAPDTTRIMNQAFEFARIALNNREDFDSLKGKMAVYIIRVVRNGERDPVRLGAKAVKECAFSGLSIPNRTVVH